jgi:ferredoxin
MKVRVNLELCCGKGLCVSNCPEVFELNGSTATVNIDEIPDELQDACRAAAFSCPTEAISVEE